MAFLYLFTEQVHDRVPYEYDIVENGDTLFHELPVFQLVNLDGDTLGRDDLLPYVTIIDFFSLEKDSLNVRTVLHGNLERTYRNIEWDRQPKPPIRFISISTGDSPEALKAYASKREEVDVDNWWILRGSPEEVYKLGAYTFQLMDFSRKTAQSEPFTAQQVALVDREGKVRKYYVGTDLIEERKIQEDLINLFKQDYPGVWDIRREVAGE
ncbi:MAG: hypothetical protein AAFP92_03135 [Bacteroidota bacterium]